jgi:hypothetical protein
MKLPSDAIIGMEKLTRYLLVPQSRGDKSAFLNRAGYGVQNAHELLRDLREQLLPLDAVALQSNQFGQYYEVRGRLTGPSGVVLLVRSIWMTEQRSGMTKFITLVPDKEQA